MSDSGRLRTEADAGRGGRPAGSLAPEPEGAESGRTSPLPTAAPAPTANPIQSVFNKASAVSKGVNPQYAAIVDGFAKTAAADPNVVAALRAVFN